MNLSTYKKFLPELIKVAFVVILLLIVSFIMVMGQTGLSAPSSSELGFSNLSPAGEQGGRIIPASCESGYEHTWGECIPPPTNFSSVCAPSGTSASSSWTLPSGYTLSYFRITDNTTGTNPPYWIPENVPDRGPSTSFVTIPGHSYTSWVHTRRGDGAYSGAVMSSFICPVPPPLNYSLSNSGTSFVTKTSGNAFTQNTITKTLTAGGTQSVTLSLSGVPTGTSYSVSNSACSPTCASVITFTVTPSTLVGTYPITVTGAPLNKQTSFNLVVSGNPMTISCSASPMTALISETVTWTASVSGGTPPLSYSWSGTNIPTSPAPNTNPFGISYSTLGEKTAILTVTDADSVQATCPAATVRINFDPRFEEF